MRAVIGVWTSLATRRCASCRGCFLGASARHKERRHPYLAASRTAAVTARGRHAAHGLASWAWASSAKDGGGPRPDAVEPLNPPQLDKPVHPLGFHQCTGWQSVFHSMPGLSSACCSMKPPRPRLAQPSVVPSALEALPCPRLNETCAAKQRLLTPAEMPRSSRNWGTVLRRSHQQVPRNVGQVR